MSRVVVGVRVRPLFDRELKELTEDDIIAVKTNGNTVNMLSRVRLFAVEQASSPEPFGFGRRGAGCSPPPPLLCTALYDLSMQQYR